MVEAVTAMETISAIDNTLCSISREHSERPETSEVEMWRCPDSKTEACSLEPQGESLGQHLNTWLQKGGFHCMLGSI